MKRMALVIALCACAGSGALAADLPQPVPAPVPICSPVASWTDWGGAACVKYLCPGIDVQIRCFH
jgi:opacity protein-like surface antigen